MKDDVTSPSRLSRSAQLNRMMRLRLLLAALGLLSLASLAASDPVELSGRYEYRTDAESLNIIGDAVCFFPDPASISKVPRSPPPKRTLWFCFSATPHALAALAIPATPSRCGYTGAGRVIVRNYKPYLGEGDGHDVADLVRVISSVPATALVAACTSAQENNIGTAPIAEAKLTPVRAGLRGVWKVTGLSSRAPGGEWAALPVNGSLYIFTEKHYSYMFATGIGPRRLFSGDPNKPSDVEKIGAYDSFVAASGTYLLSGSTLTLTALLHKNPNEMTGDKLMYTIELGDNSLQMTIVNPPFSPGRERRTVLTRVE